LSIEREGNRVRIEIEIIREGSKENNKSGEQA
jgi:hypothetical protein